MAGPGELTGGSQGAACVGGGAEIAGGGIHAGLTCAGGECAEIKGDPDPVAGVASCGDAPDAVTVGGRQGTPGGNFDAVRASSLALMTPYAMQPINMQISATNNDAGKANPIPLSTMKLAQYHSRKYFRTNSFANTIVLPDKS